MERGTVSCSHQSLLPTGPATCLSATLTTPRRPVCTPCPALKTQRQHGEPWSLRCTVDTSTSRACGWPGPNIRGSVTQEEVAGGRGRGFWREAPLEPRSRQRSRLAMPATRVSGEESAAGAPGTHFPRLLLSASAPLSQQETARRVESWHSFGPVETPVSTVGSGSDCEDHRTSQFLCQEDKVKKGTGRVPWGGWDGAGSLGGGVAGRGGGQTRTCHSCNAA